MSIKTLGTRVVALAVLLSILLTAIPSVMGSESQSTLAKFEPQDGVYIGGGTYDGQWYDFVNKAGKQPALRLTFVYFPSDRFDNRPTHQEQSLSRMAQDGVTPVVTWQPEGYILDIAAGKYDAYIRERARECKAFGKPMFIRFAHEANGGWYAWNKYPDAVKSASQRIYNIFKEEGATNVAFVWCPTFDTSNTKAWLKYYPGDAYVDWVGIDVYNWARWPRTFDAMVKDFYAEYASRKPIMIGEISSAEKFNPDPGFYNPDAQSKAKFITDMFNDMNTKYPKIKAFVWFNVEKEDNWKIDSGPESLKAFQTGVANPRYLSKVVTGGSSPLPSATPTISPTVQPTVNPTVQPTATATPAPVDGYKVDSTHRWAKYNNVYKPIEQFVVKQGTGVEQGVYFKNIGSRSDSYTVTVEGIPSSWYRVSVYGDQAVSPNDGRYGNVIITPTSGGTHKFTVKVASKANPGVYDVEQYTMYVDGPSASPTATATPTIQPTATPTATPTVQPTAQPTVTPTITPTAQPTVAPTATPVPSDGYKVDSTHRWAKYNNVYKPIEQFVVKPGTGVEQGIYFRNTGSKSDSYTVAIEGIPSSWCRFSVYGSQTVSPNEGRYGNVIITPQQAGTYKFTIKVASKANPGVYDLETYTIYVR